MPEDIATSPIDIQPHTLPVLTEHPTARYLSLSPSLVPSYLVRVNLPKYAWPSNMPSHPIEPHVLLNQQRSLCPSAHPPSPFPRNHGSHIAASLLAPLRMPGPGQIQPRQDSKRAHTKSAE